MYDTAWKQQPSNEDLGAQTFSANARTGNWKSAQQVRSTEFDTSQRTKMGLLKVATKLHKLFKDERYLYWSVFCAVLQVSLLTSIDISL